MKTHITLEPKGMGIGLRESRQGLQNLMEAHGYEYLIYSGFIRDFEERLLTQYYESQPTKTESL